MTSSVTKVLPFLQQLVAADKTAIATAIIGILGVLAAKFGFQLNGSDVAYVSAAVFGAEGLFIHAHFATQPAPAAVVVAPAPPVAPPPVTGQSPSSPPAP